MTLTDDWKAGKLNGCFWCKYPDGHIEAHLLNNLRHASYMDIEVLEPCDYEELQNLKDENKHLSDLLANQDKEVERLRNLLEVVKDRFMAYTANIPLNAEDLDLVGEINAAIGENVTENITNKNRNIIPSNESDEL